MASRKKDTKANAMLENDIQAKEEEQRRLNEELEARTAMLVKETENVLREHEAIFSKKRSMLENVQIDADDPLMELEQDVETKHKTSSQIQGSMSRKPLESSRDTSGKTRMSTSRVTKMKETHGQLLNEADVLGARDKSMSRNVNVDGSYYGDNISGLVSDVDLSTEKSKYKQGAMALDDVIPAVANEIGSENLIRFLKAKLQVTQEEIGRLSHEVNSRDESLRQLQGRLKEAEEEKGRLQRTNTAQQAQLQKHKRLMDEAKEKADSLDIQLTACKKELDSMKKNQKQAATSQGTLEVRLNRALEECEKYKVQLEKMKAGTKENLEAERYRLEELTVENKRLEKQKNELMNGYKKQLKLIDILKRKQMHIEAAKMLSFTEEEFVKAMDWGNN